MPRGTAPGRLPRAQGAERPVREGQQREARQPQPPPRRGPPAAARARRGRRVRSRARRLGEAGLIARDLPQATAAVSEEVKGPRVGAPPQAMEGFLRKTGLSENQLVERDGQHFKLYYGMSSETAMKKHSGMVANYRASEGKTVEVPYRGPLVETVKDILGGLRSTCTYVGASALRELSKRTTFIRVMEQENRTFE